MFQKRIISFEKNIFVLDANEYLERLEGKIRKCLFFMLKYSKITVWSDREWQLKVADGLMIYLDSRQMLFNVHGIETQFPLNNSNRVRAG